MAVIAVERGLYVDGAGEGGQQLPQNSPARFGVRVVSPVVSFEEGACAVAQGGQLGVVAPVQLSGEHFLAFGHGGEGRTMIDFAITSTMSLFSC